MDTQLTGKHILITGGTGTLGSAFVKKALKQGAVVYFTYISSRSVAEDLIQDGAKGFQVDLADMRAIDEFAAAIKKETKILDVLIHNAALTRDKTIQNLTEEDWDAVLNVNLKAPYYLTKKLLSLLFKAPVSKIFMLISRIAITGGYGTSQYAASKAGLIGLTKSLAAELGKKKVLVNALNPGFMESRMTQDLPESVFETNRETSAIHEFSNPEHVADFMIYLCSDAMNQITGQVFHVDSRKI